MKTPAPSYLRFLPFSTSVLLAIPLFLCAQQSVENRSAIVASTSTLDSSRQALVNINNVWLKVRGDGLLGYDTVKFHGMSYPKQLGDLLYGDDLLWVGNVKDGVLPALRTGGGTWRVGAVPGAITGKGTADNPASPSVRVYRIRPDYKYADLADDAAGCYGVPISSVTTQMINAVRDQYDRDWKEWPWQKGAPFVDANKNGVLDQGENPGFMNADQVVWYVYNDLNDAVCRAFSGDPPIGLEVQVTMWAYKDIPILGDVIFKRYRLLYKGTSTTAANAWIDSMYISQFADPSIGVDLGGCDSVLNLGFVFNSNDAVARYFDTPNLPPNIAAYRQAGLPIPGIGYALLQGPLVHGTSSDEGLFDFKPQIGKKNLPMTSFLLNATGDFIVEPINGARTKWYWNAMRGFVPREDITNSQPWVDSNGVATKFMCAGDPLAHIGWIDGWGKFWAKGGGIGESVDATYRRFMMNTGPFTMALKDTQEVVLAVMASPGADGPYHSSYLKYMTASMRGFYPGLDEYISDYRKMTTSVSKHAIPLAYTLEQNYPNPFNPSTRINFEIPVDGMVKLAVYDVLGREVRVLQQGELRAGQYTVTWDGRDEKNAVVASGVYLYRLTAGSLQISRKLLLVR